MKHNWMAVCLLLAVLILGATGCAENDVADGDEPDGDTVDGDQADGDEPDGDLPDGDKPDGDVDGDVIDGDADGDVIDGDADGDVIDGDADGDVIDGDTDGDVIDGDADDDVIDGDADGDVIDGDADGDAIDGDEDGDAIDGDEDGDVDGDVVDGDEDGDVIDGDDDAEAPVCPQMVALECGDRLSHNNLIQGRANQWQDYSCGGASQASYEVIYELVLADDCEATVSLESMAGDLNLFELDSCTPSDCAQKSANSGTANESLTVNGLNGDGFVFVVDAEATITSNYIIDVSCTCGVDGDEDGDVDIEADAEEDDEGLLDLGPIPGLTPNFNYSSAEFFNNPWPSNYHIGDDGKINLPSFPRPPLDFNNPIPYLLVSKYINLAEATLTGFGPNTSIYFTFDDGPLNTASLPQTVAATLSWDSSVLLIDIDPQSPDYGTLVPLDWHWSPTETQYEPGNLLAIGPADGFPLHPNGTYAAILTDGVLDSNDDPLGRTQTMADIYSGRATPDDKLNATYEPLAEFLAANIGSFDPERVRAATVFTIEDPVAETATMRDYVRAQYPDGAISGQLVSCEDGGYDQGFFCFEGKYTSPNFQVVETYYDLQQGQMVTDYAYAQEGGQFEFDSNGHPVVQATETLDFVLCIPDGVALPGGWPLVIYSHGTTGDRYSMYQASPIAPMEELTAQGMAIISIDQPLHGTRAQEVYTDAELELYSFNFGNPDSARSLQRQSVLDNVVLIDFIQSGLLNLTQSGCDSWPSGYTHTSVPIDTSKLFFMGHSQGGLVGAMLAGIETELRGYVLSGSGGRIGITVMEREDPNILELLAGYGIIGSTDEAYKLHPLLTLVQLLTEITDPINYARHWVAEPGDDRARQVYMTTGFSDQQTPKNSSYALATSGRVPLIADENDTVPEPVPGLLLRGIGSFTQPASGTVIGPDDDIATCGLSQYPTGTHFVIFNDALAAERYTYFLNSAAYLGLGVIGEFPTP